MPCIPTTGIGWGGARKDFHFGIFNNRASCAVQMSKKQFQRITGLVYQHSGIHLHEGKEILLSARLAKRLRATGIVLVEEYLKVLERDPQEMIAFLDAISTNHTSFFRESHHFAYLQEKHAHIWCAASSSGEEPYSMAIHCREKGYTPLILATDLSTRVLATAAAGIYPMEKAKDIPSHLLRKYFQKGCGSFEGHIRVREEIRKMVSFKRINLLEDPPPSQTFDVIFCRNVLIYFDKAAKEKVLNKLNQVLKQKGYLVVGGAESLSSLKHSYSYVKPSVYRKL
jgi:chemotaxis protein methyltransferase CheR